jgi:hypothetical protein
MNRRVFDVDERGCRQMLGARRVGLAGFWLSPDPDRNGFTAPVFYLEEREDIECRGPDGDRARRTALFRLSDRAPLA